MNIGIIGDGAIGRYVREQLRSREFTIRAVLVLPDAVAAQSGGDSATVRASRLEDLPDDIDHMIDCAGHEALRSHGPAILKKGIDLTTVSIGALADDELHTELQTAATEGGATLHLVSGAIGALDCLRAARVGELHRVTYIGRKPPMRWRGSPAESRLDLSALGDRAEIHFNGTARQAAREYPKNANVAAAVALAGIGFDRTEVRLIADPNVSENVHEVDVAGDFGRFSFQIRGNALPDNPSSSALAAMSVVSALAQASQPIRF